MKIFFAFENRDDMRLLICAILLLQSILVQAQDFKVVGYLPYYRFELVDQIDFSKITHLNLAFLNPDIDGNLSIGDQDIDPIIAKAKEVNPDVLVYISLAGGYIAPEWKQAYDKFLLPEYRDEFVQLLVTYVLEHDLDGIDVDLEWNHVNEYYSPFVLLLGDALKAQGKSITAALPGIYRYPDVTDEAMHAFDWINLMAYDLTGPWAPNNPGPHSPRSFATQSIDYWTGQGLSGEQMTLGVPFYGWDFTNSSNITAFTFAVIVNEDANHAYSDQVGERYYNGIPTIQHKTYEAKGKVGGIMIWELGQDSFSEDHEYSLLAAIDEVVTTGVLPVTDLLAEVSNDIRIYPNPCAERLHLDLPGGSSFSVSIADMHGRSYGVTQQINRGEASILHLNDLPNGMYLIQLTDGERSFRKTFIRM